MQVIAIQNYGSSGSMFLGSLLDSHPRVACLPGTYPIGIYTHLRNAISSLKAENKLSLAALAESTLIYVTPLYSRAYLAAQNGLLELGENRDRDCAVDAGHFSFAFHFHVKRLCEGIAFEADGTGFPTSHVRRALICAIYLAYEGCTGRNWEKLDHLSFPLHSSIRQDALDLLEDFPGTRIVHMVREPSGNFDSCIKYYRIVRKNKRALYARDLVESGLAQICCDRSLEIDRDDPMHSLVPTTPESRGNSIGVRLEDLHHHPEPTLRALSEWLGIGWSDTLLKSTFRGFTWWNRSYLTRVSGFDPKIVQTYRDTSAFDRWRIQRLAAPIRRHFGYETKNLLTILQDWLVLPACLLRFNIENEDPQGARTLALWAEHFRETNPAAAKRVAYFEDIRALSFLEAIKAKWYARIKSYMNVRAALFSARRHVLADGEMVARLPVT